MVSIGIIGAGAVGQALAGQLTRTGYDVAIANSRNPESLGDVIKGLGPLARAATAAEAAEAPIVILAVRWAVLEPLAAALSLESRVVVDACNPYVVQDGALVAVDLGNRTSSQFVQSLFPSARVIKAFNNQYAAVLADDPRPDGRQRVMFVSGDDAEAKNDIMQVMSKVGWAPLDLGDLAVGGHVQRGRGPLAGVNLVLGETLS